MTHQVIFGEGIRFHLCWHNLPELANASIKVYNSSFAKPIEEPVAAPAEAQEGDLIDLAIDLDLASRLVPPFSTITYTWTLEFIDGAQTIYGPETIHYIDDKIAWVTTESDEGMIRVHTAPGDEPVGEVAIEILQRSKLEIVEYLPASPRLFEPIDAYLYPDPEMFINTMRLTGLNWVAGKASPDIGVMMVPISDRQAIETELNQRLPHELAHLLIYRAAGSAFDNIPAWVDEGFATQFEKPVNPNYTSSISNVNNSTQLVPFGQMCVNLPTQPPEIALRGYAQSYELMRFILTEVDGKDAIEKIISAAGDSEIKCSEVVKNALDQTGDEIAEDWLSSIRPQFPDPRSPVWIGIALIIFSFVFIILVLWGRTDNSRTIGDYNR